MGNAEENLSVPPGFESLTTLKLKKIVSTAVEGDLEPGVVGVPLRNSDIERFKASFVQRPWISHGQFGRVQHQDDSEQIGAKLVLFYFLQCNFRLIYYHNLWSSFSLNSSLSWMCKYNFEKIICFR